MRRLFLGSAEFGDLECFVLTWGEDICTGNEYEYGVTNSNPEWQPQKTPPLRCYRRA
jgi:hypothetical protein